MLSRTPRLLLLVPLVCLMGCTSENKGKIEGTRWRSEAGSVTSHSPVTSGRVVHLQEGYMELDFQNDGGLFYIIGGKLYTGKYTLGMGNVVILRLEEPLAGLKTHSEKIVIEGKRLTMTDTDGTTLAFQKQN